MKICKHCGEENPDNKNWCKKCMKPLRDDSAEALPLSTEKVTSDKPAKSGIIRKVSDDPGKMSKSEDGFDKTEIENHCRIYGSMGPKNRSVSEEKAEKEESEQEDTSGLKGRIGRKEYGRGEGRNSRIIRPTQRYCTRCSAPVDGEETLCPKCRNQKKKTKTIWLRVVAALLVVAMWSGIAVYFVGNRTPKVKNAEQAISALKDMGEELGYENAFSELTEKSTTTIDGDTYYRLQQNYKGIPVYGRTVVCSTDKDFEIKTLSGNITDVDTQIDMNTAVNKGLVENAIVQHFMDEYQIEDLSNIVCSNIDETSLCIYIDKSNVPHLSYEVDVICCGSKFGMYKALVDVKSTEVLLTESQIYYDAYVIGSLFGQNYLFHNVEYSSENDIAKLYDQTRNITATELNPASFVETIKLLWEKGKQSNKIILPTDEKFVDSSAISWVSSEKPRGEAVDAYVHTQIAYDYFDTEMNHKPNINGNPIPIQVITGFEYLFEESEYKNFINNAFHVTTEQNGELTLFLAFGKGSFGKDCISGNLDVVAHEYMHSVESCYSNMVYKGESGALMEALSDIFGEIVEYWYYSSQNPLYEMNWIHNQRSIADPDGSNKENDRYPVKYNGTYWGDTSADYDNGYVHKNSTVISHAAYLMWCGIDGDSSRKIDTEKLADIWYRAMLMMPSDCNFVECRTLVELAASTMNLTDMQKQCVCEAFDTVGIPRASEEEYSQLVHLDTNGETAVKGTVYEVKTVDGIETVVPVPKATVTVYDENASKVCKKLNMKDKDGFFEIELPAGTYSVSITAEGYIGQTITFELYDNEVRHFSIAMEPVEEKPTEAPTETPIKDNVLSGKCGDNLTWTLENGVLTISGTGAMYDYDPLGLSTDTSAIPAPWYDYAYNNEVTAIQIGDGVTYIGAYAFACCWNIDTIRIPGNVKQIGEHAFHACSSTPEKKLDVVIENGVEIIGNGAFFECFAMNLVDLPDSITYIGDAAFWNCRLKSITIPKNVTYIGSQVFYGVSSNTLKNIYFTGNAPQFADDAFLEEHLTVYYPGDNTTWARSVMKDYGGNINWVKEHKPITLGSFKNLSEAYIFAINSKPNDMFSYGMLEDIDNDGTDELILGYCDSINIDGTEWAAHCYSIYDYKNKNLICCVDNEVICYDVAGVSGRIGVVNYKNKPTLMQKKWKAPNGTSGDLFEDYYTLLDADKYRPFRELRVDQHNERDIWYEYYVDNSEVIQDGFEDELRNYKYLALNSKGMVDYSYPEKSFDELKEYLDSLVAPQTGMELAAYRSILENAMKNSGYDANDEYTQSYCEGILVDLDGDDVKELVLKHFDTDSPAAGGAERLLSVYDYENNKVVTRLDKASFGEFGFAGSYGYASVVYRDGNAFPVTYYEVGETSADASIGANMLGVMTIYDGENCKKLHSYRIDRDNGVISCEIDGKAVSERDFINHVEQYEGIKVVCDVYELIKLPDTFITAADLMKQLK